MPKKLKPVTTAPLDSETEAILSELARQTGQSRAQLSKRLIRLGAIAFQEHCKTKGRNLGGSND